MLLSLSTNKLVKLTSRNAGKDGDVQEQKREVAREKGTVYRKMGSKGIPEPLSDSPPQFHLHPQEFPSHSLEKYLPAGTRRGVQYGSNWSRKW